MCLAQLVGDRQYGGDRVLPEQLAHVRAAECCHHHQVALLRPGDPYRDHLSERFRCGLLWQVCWVCGHIRFSCVDGRVGRENAHPTQCYGMGDNLSTPPERGLWSRGERRREGGGSGG